MPEAGAKAPCNRHDALAVLLRLRDAGHEAYFAGGCVRDMLLGLTPSDFDVATSAPPKTVQTLFSNAQAVGAAFGVILVRHAGSQVEVATFRSDGQYLDGRHPVSVKFSTAEEDAQRRDFTVNALFYDPVNDKVIDHVGGREDLQNRLIRAVGTPAARFDEDHLRMLRAVRFAARFGFLVEPETAEALRLHAPRIISISPERIADELRRMLTAPTRAAAWPMLFQFNLIAPIFRHALENRAAQLHPTSSLFLGVEPGSKISFPLALAAAALDLTRDPSDKDLRPLLAKPNVSRLVRAMRTGLKISNDESDAMAAILKSIPPLLPGDGALPSLAARKRFLALPAASASRGLLDAMALLDLHRAQIDELRPALAALDGTEVAPAPLITGDDLTAAGLAPGPIFSRVLTAVYDAQLEGAITNKSEGMALALRFAGAMQGEP